MIRLTAPEEDALKAIWATGEGNVKDIMGNMAPPLPPYTTLASTIKKLEKNGMITSRLIGNTYLYKSIITESEYKKSYLKNMVESYFGNSYKNLVTFFAAEKKLTPEELRDLAALIEQNNNNNK
jgi:BlaI family transcriptional regulator, penicillinase repressor